MTTPDRVLELLEAERAKGWHLGAQVFASRNGEVLLDAAIGESTPGRALERDDLMLMYSSGKPLTAVAILQLRDAGKLTLEDRIAAYIPGWGNGKESCTIHHVLTHTGGFPLPTSRLFDTDLPYADAVAEIAASPAEWEPGTAAGYHPFSGWKVLGAIVEAVDGRTITQYVRDEIAAPLGVDLRISISREEQAELGARIAPIHWNGYTVFIPKDGMMQMVPYRADEWHNEPWHIAKAEPGGTTRGSARSLGRFYESLLGFGSAILSPTSAAELRATHRSGLKDRSLPVTQPWGLGVQLMFTGGTSRTVFGHNGMGSSRGLADTATGLVFVVITNGLANVLDNEQRLFELTDAIYSSLDDEVQAIRRPAKLPSLQELMG